MIPICAEIYIKKQRFAITRPEAREPERLELFSIKIILIYTNILP